MKQKNKISLTNIEFILIVFIGIILGAGAMIFIEPNFASKDNVTTADPNVINMISMYNDILSKYYGDVNEAELAEGAINGMLSAVGDPYTVYMDDTYDNFNITINGSYEGIGIEIAKVSDEITIIGILADSPAKEAGLKSGDVILKIDDKDVSNLTTDELSKYIRNSSNPTFNMVIRRDGEEKEITINRKTVVLKSVKSELIKKGNKKIGYLYMSIFALNTYNQFKEALANLEKEGIDSLILDLRNNSGGELNTATNITSLFMNQDNVIYQIEYKDGKVEKTYSKGSLNKEYPIVVLTNGYTASAAEVLTAALKENLDATIVGEKTYGKGTVQTVLNTASGAKYKMTTSKWLTPSGKWINETGINPDIVVESSNTDEVVNKAIEYIVNK